MDWFNYRGLIIVIVLMAPNVVFMATHKDGFVNLWTNRAVEALEQIGRYGCFALMVFNIPYTWFGFWAYDALRIYVLVNTALAIVYCVIWIADMNGGGIFRALSLSILPSVIFLFSGIMLLSIPLIAAAAIFAPCHILISYKNAALAKTTK